MKVVKHSTEFSVTKIPDDLSFDALNLAIDPDTGTLEFDWAPLREILALNPELSLNSDSAVIDLIGAWYSYLRLNGYRHEVAEQYLLSCEAAREFGAGHLFAGPDTVH